MNGFSMSKDYVGGPGVIHKQPRLVGLGRDRSATIGRQRRAISLWRPS